MISNKEEFGTLDYIVDDRQLYLVKEAGNSLDLADWEDLASEYGRINCTDAVYPDLIEAEVETTKTECGVDEAEAVSDLNEEDAHYYSVNNRIAKNLRSQIERLVKQYDKLHKFDLNYSGIVVTDLEYQALMKLSNGCLIALLLCAYDGDRKTNGRGSCNNWYQYDDESVKLTDIKNWKDLVIDRDLTTDDLKKCDSEFLKAYQQLKPTLHEFKLNYKLPQQVDYSVNCLGDKQDKFIDALAAQLTDEEYHELCHQLHGTKSEFDGDDDGEVHLDYADHNYKKYYTVKASLYRGIFWRTIAQLDQFDQFNKPGVICKPNIFY